MTGKEIIAYLNNYNIGLRGHYEKSNGVEPLSSSLRTYIESRIPIILLVDAGRLHSSGVIGSVSDSYKVNIPEATNRQPHALVVVGVSKDQNATLFLFNDPGVGPYLKADPQQLWDSRLSERSSLTKDDTADFIAVTPLAVRLPLSSTSLQLGIRDIAPIVDSSFAQDSSETAEGEVEFRLLDLKDNRSDALRTLAGWVAGSPTVAEYLSGNRTEVVPKRWCWVQRTSNCSRVVHFHFGTQS